ncbi:sensor histidine kinase [Blastochloris sulfoviridis]|uniref:histidine kinase n=1 Tax=Blastochloris sulfoviridis TaxID=50712 RepID=A0A5M6I0G5_9HYPH|nr:HAMP domain-containing sensor histidine kinase [Blastochloris sulfoviridis]KAA5601680.1 HAMP domain-containing histidine kinase [Blastochloris sulfoviridis]
MIGGSLRLRLFAAGAVSILLALGLAALGLTTLFERHVERRMATDLTVILDRLVAGLDSDTTGKLTETDPPDDPRFDKPLAGLYWQVTAESGVVVDRSRSLWDSQLALPADELSEGTLHRHHIPGPGGGTLLAVERRVILSPRLGGGAVRVAVAQDVADINAATRDFAGDLLPFLGLVALLLVAASAVQVAVGLAPLKAVQARLAAIRVGTAERLGRAFPDEVRPLAVEVDALLDQRERQVTAARARASDLAHGLKTPLQVLAGDIDRLQAKGESAIAADLAAIGEAMRRHVERELARTRRTAGSVTARAAVAAVAEQVIAVVRRTPRGEVLEWSNAVPADLAVRIQPDDLTEILGNLLENAARHAAERIEVRAATEADWVVVSVIDDGPGIPEVQVPIALRRGGRLDQTGPGTGLGLAIAADLAEAWDGTLTLGPTAPGAMTAVVRLPRAG